MSVQIGDRVSWWAVNGIGQVEKVHWRGRGSRSLHRGPATHATVVWRPARGGKITAPMVRVAELQVVGPEEP